MPSKKPNPLNKKSANPLTKLKAAKAAAPAAAKPVAAAVAPAPQIVVPEKYTPGGELKKLELPPAPAERGVNEVHQMSAIITPAYCRPREDAKATSRLRSGVPMVRAVATKLEKDAAGCDDVFLQELVARRMAANAEHTIKIHQYDGRQAFRMNMDETLAGACVGMMERNDFTYGAMTSAKDIADSALHLPCLNSVETLENGDFVSHAFCLVYQLFLFRTMRSKLQWMLRHENLSVRAVALIYMRYISAPAQLLRDMQLAHILSEDGPVVLREEAGNDVTMPLSQFAEKLLITSANPDFLDAMFPPYTAVEEAWLQQCIPLIKAHRANQLLYLAHNPPPSKAQKDADRKEQKETNAKEHAEAKKRYSAFSTMLHGFQDVGTQIGYVTYMATSNVDALRAQQDEQRLRMEMERYAAEQEAARLAEEAQRSRPQAVDSIEMKQKPRKQPLKPAKKPRAGPSPTPPQRKADEAAAAAAETEKKAKKRKKTKLQQDADTYLF